METACYPVIQLMVKRANPDGGTMEFQAQPEGTWGGSGKGRNSGRKVVGSSALDRPYELHKNRSWRDVKATSCSLAQFCLFATPCTISHQAPLSIGFPWGEYSSGLPLPALGDLPKPGIKPESPALTSRFFITEPPGKSQSQNTF